jgi:hypothetical protein
MSSTVLIQPIFAPDKPRLKRNLDSLKSLSEYILKNKLEINIVLGGWAQKDEYFDEIKNFCNKNNFPNLIHVYKFKKNYGKATIVNNLYDKLREKNINYEYILTADSDIVFDINEENIFGRLEEYASKSQEIRGKPFGMIALNQKAQCCHLSMVYENEVKYISNFGKEERVVYPNGSGGIAGGCIFVSKEAWEKIGGYRVMGVYAGDDAYLLIDLYRNGYSINMFDSLSIVHPHDHDEDYAKWKVKVCQRDAAGTIRNIDSRIEEAEEYWRGKIK